MYQQVIMHTKFHFAKPLFTIKALLCVHSHVLYVWCSLAYSNAVFSFWNRRANSTPALQHRCSLWKKWYQTISTSQMTHIATAIDDFTTLKVRIIIGMSTSVATNRGQLTNMSTGSGPDLPLVGTACTCQITPCKHSYSYGKFHYSRKTASYTQQQPIYGQHMT